MLLLICISLLISFFASSFAVSLSPTSLSLSLFLHPSHALEVLFCSNPITQFPLNIIELKTNCLILVLEPWFWDFFPLVPTWPGLAGLFSTCHWKSHDTDSFTRLDLPFLKTGTHWLCVYYFLNRMIMATQEPTPGCENEVLRGLVGTWVALTCWKPWRRVVNVLPFAFPVNAV